MSLATDFRNASYLLAHREWREFVLRVEVFLGIIDLKIDDFNAMPTDRTYPYSNTGGVDLKKVLDTLNISPDDAIIDFGSGKGGALISFASYPFKKITGVEIDPGLTVVAKKNLQKLKLPDIDMILGDATEFTDISDYNYFYLANPFPAIIVLKVIENIKLNLMLKPRRVYIIYFNPIHQNEIIHDASFRLIKHFDHCPLGFSIYSNESH